MLLDNELDEICVIVLIEWKFNFVWWSHILHKGETTEKKFKKFFQAA